MAAPLKFHAVVHKDNVEQAMRANSYAARRYWHQFPAAMGFLADQFPGPWSAINDCRQNWSTYDNPNKPDYVLLRPRYTCRQRPFCILCNRAETWKRVSKAMDRFVGTTPRGQRESFIHIVQTAPVGNEGQYLDGGDWGVQAIADPAGFRRLVWNTLKESYGDGIGAFLTFQPFGERPTEKWHPHVDLTLSGWAHDDKPRKLRQIELRGGGRERWDEAIRRRAMKYQLNAAIGNVKFGHAATGQAEYVKTLAYQTRELVNPEAFIEWDRSKQVLHWASYHDNSRTRISARRFHLWLAEYQGRFGMWGDKENGHQRKNLEQFYGILSERNWEDVKAKVGGVERRTHAYNCECEYHGDWELMEENPWAEKIGRKRLSDRPGESTPWPSNVLRPRETVGEGAMTMPCTLD